MRKFMFFTVLLSVVLASCAYSKPSEKMVSLCDQLCARETGAVTLSSPEGDDTCWCWHVRTFPRGMNMPNDELLYRIRIIRK